MALANVGVLFGVGSFLLDWSLRSTCRDMLQDEVGMRCRAYAQYNDGRYPPDWDAINKAGWCSCGKELVCVSTSEDNAGSWIDGKWRIDERKVGWVYVRGLHREMPSDFIVAFDRSGNHSGLFECDGRNVLFLSGEAEWWPSSREAELQNRLKQQRETIKKGREAGAKREDLSKFFGKLVEKQKR
jgi:hypothetical protein